MIIWIMAFQRAAITRFRPHRGGREEIVIISHFRTKWSKVLLAWLLMMVIYIFPEAGLVLFMSIYHWVSVAGIIYHTPVPVPVSQGA